MVKIWTTTGFIWEISYIRKTVTGATELRRMKGI